MNKRDQLHAAIDAALDRLDAADYGELDPLKRIELSEPVGKDIAEGEMDDNKEYYSALLDLDNIGWELSKLWALLQLSIDGEPAQISEIYIERVQELYQEYLLSIAQE